MIRALPAMSLRWRLVAWVSAVLLAGFAATFAVVYVQTGARLRDQVDGDVRGDLAQLVQTARGLPAGSPGQIAARLRAYVGAQPFSGTSSLLFAVIPGRATVSNHPELFGRRTTDDGETPAEQSRENTQGRAIRDASDGLHTLVAPDVGPARVGLQTIEVGGTRVRLGAGEPLLAVIRAQRGIARAFIIAGAVALAIVLIASYLAGAAVLTPLRRLARVAGRVDDGELEPRMVVSAGAGREIQVLADAFNRMLDRLAAAFDQQRAFVADASHELRTPLTVIAGQLEVLAADRDPTPADIERVQRIVSAEVARTSRLVDDLLLLARAEQRDFVRPVAFALRPFIEDLWAATTAGHRRRFELAPVPDAVLVADPDRLAQALRNLIANAIVHTSAPGGLVRLEVEELPGGRGVRCAVLDDGPGIPAEDRERVFERFHRTDASRSRAAGGAGLGLAIVRAIARAHAGEARAVAPGVGGGTRMELVIRASRVNASSSRAGEPIEFPHVASNRSR